ncbi:hypothetical protein [Geomonas sp.]|uniref:hypothetical protein n=1 Tax=Geomonas sp. TaxID=2651584 RepID=UPI002B45E5B0|nr:hypothetical protein [Geomonas sp.]HJV36520.1 hypothetical protein [Geomonas sp.]
MRYVFKLVLLFAVTCTFGCAHNYYNIPQETVEKKIRVIGVAPFFTDADSDLKHPEKAAVVTLVRTVNSKNEKELIARLRDTGIFYSVRPVEGDPTTLFAKLVASRERRDDAGIIYNKYFFKKDELKQLMTENELDAILLVTVSGLTKRDKVYASNFLSYLETDYNYLTMTAQLIDREGSTIWEYPNFRRSALSYTLLLPLQYPDFDEAAANLSEKVDVKFKTVPGITAAFAKTESSAAKGPDVSKLYATQYDEMITLLTPYKPLFGGKKDAPAPAPAPVPVEQTTSVQPAASEPAAATPKAAEPAPQAAQPAAAQAAPKASAPSTIQSGDIVPEQPVSGDVVPEQPAK